MQKLTLTILAVVGCWLVVGGRAADTNQVQGSHNTTNAVPVMENSLGQSRPVRAEPKRDSLAKWKEEAFTEMGISLDRPASAFIYARSKSWILISLHPLEPPPGVLDEAVWFFDVNIERSPLARFRAAQGKLRPNTEMSVEKAQLSAAVWNAHIFRRSLQCSNGDVVSIEARVFPYTTRSGKSFVSEDSEAARRIVDSVRVTK
jgi:hypothetical protein